MVVAEWRSRAGLRHRHKTWETGKINSDAEQTRIWHNLRKLGSEILKIFGNYEVLRVRDVIGSKLGAGNCQKMRVDWDKWIR